MFVFLRPYHFTTVDGSSLSPSPLQITYNDYVDVDLDFGAIFDEGAFNTTLLYVTV